MTMSRYLCAVVGEQPQQVQRLHESTQRRLKAFAIAIHIPVALWVVTGYLIATRVFHLRWEVAAPVAALCAVLIYLVERLVLATPKSLVVNAGRLVIGVVISVLGATAIDLVIFEREVALQLRAAGEARITREFDAALQSQRREAEIRKADWMRAQEAAQCEANGTCGSRTRNLGPIFQELTRQAERLRRDYDATLGQVDRLEADRARALAEWRTSPRAVEEAGLLSRVEALHDYTMSNTAALVAWALFFMLVLCMELMVVFAKLVFGETVDDHLVRIREELSHHRARSYLEATTSPLAGAQSLLQTSV